VSIPAVTVILLGMTGAPEREDDVAPDHPRELEQAELRSS